MLPVFKDNEITKIYISIHPDSLAEMLAPENLESYHEYPARFIFQNSQLNDTIFNVGFRIRGNTSRFSAKKSFKVSFNTFTDGGSFYGLEKINLNGEHNDPGIIRSKLSWDILYNFNVPATRSNHVELYINNEYRGLYMNVEHIDEEFVEARYGNKDGNLYKCLYPSDLTYMGTNQNNYRNIYELKTNTEENNYTDLINFIDIVNNIPLEQLQEKLENVFNVNNFLKFHAVEVFTGHWDSYSYLKNNFYLYQNTKTGKFEYIPYDMDNTFGIDWFGIDWGNRNIYNWSNDGEYRPLIERLMEIDVYKDRFSYYLNQLIEDIVNADILLPKIENIKTMISPSAQADQYRTYDYGWSYEEFLASYYTALSTNHVTYGLTNYIETRLYSINEQIELANIAPIIYYTESSRPAINAELTINALMEDETNDLDVVLHYILNAANETISMNRINDSRMDMYQAAIDIAASGSFKYYITATDETGNSTRYPFAGEITIQIPEENTPGLFINEIMAGNTITYADENGEYDDWIEIYNASDQEIWLGDYYLSDNIDLPSKYKFPDANLAAGAFLIVWADDDVEQGLMHAEFKLSKDGEEVVLSKLVNTTYQTIDYLAFGQIDSDISFGKLPDGNGIPQLLSPTPAAPNLVLDLPEVDASFFVTVFPNPFMENITIESNSNLRAIAIINIYGQVVYDERIDSKTWHLQPNLAAGIYFIQIVDEFGEKKIVKVLAN